MSTNCLNIRSLPETLKRGWSRCPKSIRAGSNSKKSPILRLISFTLQVKSHSLPRHHHHHHHGRWRVRKFPTTSLGGDKWSRCERKCVFGNRLKFNATAIEKKNPSHSFCFCALNAWFSVECDFERFLNTHEMGQRLSCVQQHDDEDHALFRALARGELERVEAMVEEDSTVLGRTVGYDRLSPLHVAAANGRIEVDDSFVLSCLLELNGVFVAICFHHAEKKNWIWQVVSLLLERSFNVDVLNRQKQVHLFSVWFEGSVWMNFLLRIY